MGICFGFQLAAVSFARNVCELSNANSTEIDDKTEYPIIDLLPEQNEVSNMGGSLRLGANKINIEKETNAHQIYQCELISRDIVIDTNSTQIILKILVKKA